MYEALKRSTGVTMATILAALPAHAKAQTIVSPAELARVIACDERIQTQETRPAEGRYVAEIPGTGERSYRLTFSQKRPSGVGCEGFEPGIDDVLEVEELDAGRTVRLYHDHGADGLGENDAVFELTGSGALVQVPDPFGIKRSGYRTTIIGAGIDYIRNYPPG